MTFAYSVFKEKTLANVKTDRVLKLSPIEGAAIMVNNKRSAFNAKMFMSSYQLHCVQDNGLWHLEAKNQEGTRGSVLPEQLKQQWTNFNQMIKCLESYFAARNVKIEEIIA
jgi:hypothetical protein